LRLFTGPDHQIFLQVILYQKMRYITHLPARNEFNNACRSSFIRYTININHHVSLHLIRRRLFRALLKTSSMQAV